MRAVQPGACGKSRPAAWRWRVGAHSECAHSRKSRQVGIRTKERRIELCADTACPVTASPSVTQIASMTRTAYSCLIWGRSRIRHPDFEWTAERHEASWAGHTREVMREGRVVWRIPFDRPPVPA